MKINLTTWSCFSSFLHPGVFINRNPGNYFFRNKLTNNNEGILLYSNIQICINTDFYL